MKITVATVGKLKPGALKTLYGDYVGRLPWPVVLREIANRTDRSAAERMHREGELLLAAIPAAARTLVLDVKGRSHSSEDLAAEIGRAQAKDGDLAFVIGGADGLADSVRKRADLVIAFGAQTWPHFLVRAMLAEQLYRASTILAGHPYHRS